MIRVLCPSRGNPAAAHDAADALTATAVLPTTSFLAVTDEDDPLHVQYDMPQLIVPTAAGGNMNNALNYAALREAADIIGFIGDDHRFRTKGWDATIEATLARPGIAYGDDLGQHEALPTAVFISRVIVQALGWYGLPGAYHLYLDDTWKRLGEEAGCLHYLPDVIIEHMHPAFGKGVWDANHILAQNAARIAHDYAIYQAWDSAPDVARVRAVL